MTPWESFTALLAATLGPENVEAGKIDTMMAANLEIPQDGSTAKRHQKVHFQYDGKDTTWVSATSFITAAKGDYSPLLEYLGKDWKKPAVVIINGYLALRDHFSLAVSDGSHNAKDADRKLLDIAFRTAYAVGGLADYIESNVVEKDVQ